MSWNLKKNHMHLQDLEFSAKQFSAESNNTKGFRFQNYSNFQSSLAEERQQVGVEKTSLQ